jgi:2,5-diketo-D-gluconate reductase B
MVPNDMPQLGLGTYSDDNRGQWTGVVNRAIEMGYRHIDTALVYENQQYVGTGIESADVDREELFLATKIVHVDAPSPEHDDVVAAAERCLNELGIEYVDLLYIHWPAGTYDPEVTLPAFDELRNQGLIRHIGVSNFSTRQLDRARDILNAPIAAHQVECHPLLPQDELRAYARKHDHWLVAYCPLARTKAFERPEIQAIAEKHGATPSQVCLAWLLAMENVAAVPKATSEEHLRDNLAALDIELDEDDRKQIGSIDERLRLIDREYAPWR